MRTKQGFVQMVTNMTLRQAAASGPFANLIEKADLADIIAAIAARLCCRWAIAWLPAQHFLIFDLRGDAGCFLFSELLFSNDALLLGDPKVISASACRAGFPLCRPP